MTDFLNSVSKREAERPESSASQGWSLRTEWLPRQSWQEGPVYDPLLTTAIPTGYIHMYVLISTRHTRRLVTHGGWEQWVAKVETLSEWQEKGWEQGARNPACLFIWLHHWSKILHPINYGKPTMQRQGIGSVPNCTNEQNHHTEGSRARNWKTLSPFSTAKDNFT